MTKFTKTQTALLDLLAKKGRIGVGRYNGFGADGGKVRGGNRETDAALKLEAMGLLVRIGYSNHRITKNGWSIHTSDITYVAAPKQEG